MKYIIKSMRVLFIGLLISLTSCSDWLVLEPENNLVLEEFWKSQSDVEGVIATAYKELRSTLDENIRWGDLRSDLYIVAEKTTSSEIQIKNLNILPNNEICRWSNFYSVINYSNSVIKMAPAAQANDAAFSIAERDELMAEARFLRSLCYFYLVRTFNEVPLIQEPYLTDQVEVSVAKSSEREILDFIISDLKKAVESIPSEYEEDWQNKGRATFGAVNALLADVYLWDEKYDECTLACDRIINSGRYTMIPGDSWFDIFSEGNTDEGIFELQWDSEAGQNNSLYGWFYQNPRYMLSERFSQDGDDPLYQTNDIRGYGVTVEKTDNFLWKFIGETTGEDAILRGSPSKSDANWIYYRMADVYLMKAEALVEKENYESALELLYKVRNRAGLTEEINIEFTKHNFEDLILDERLRELAGEGKRWFDLLRTARRNNFERQEMLIDFLLINVSATDRNIYKAKLSDPNSYYLPIHNKELDYNMLLEQNPYYVTQ